MKYILLFAVLAIGVVVGIRSTDTSRDVYDVPAYQPPVVETLPVVEVLPSSSSVTVYDGISVPSDTTTLDLSRRGLSGSLKAEVRFLSALEVLDLSHNEFTGLPAEVGQLRNLTTLNLSHNPFTGLPRELGQLSNLRVLDLRGTNYSAEDLNSIQAALPSGVVILKD